MSPGTVQHVVITDKQVEAVARETHAFLTERFITPALEKEKEGAVLVAMLAVRFGLMELLASLDAKLEECGASIQEVNVVARPDRESMT